MLPVLRRLGIALGSLVAACLVMGLVGGLVVSLFGLNTSSPAGMGQFGGGLVLTLLTIALGGLIYRDIIRRERRPS